MATHFKRAPPLNNGRNQVLAKKSRERWEPLLSGRSILEHEMEISNETQFVKTCILASHKPSLGAEAETLLNRFTRPVYQNDHSGALSG